MNVKSRNKAVAIQGVSGAFHEIAARHYFDEETLDIIPATTFDDLVEMVQNSNRVNQALMAIENTIAGSLLHNYQLLYESNLYIVGEIYLRIKQNLMVAPNTDFSNITEVHSHPIAIAQCLPFFKQYPQIKLVEKTDTALSAKSIIDDNLQHVGAIASQLAANIYGLDIIEEGIESVKSNYTRFLVLSNKKKNKREEQGAKVSICFSVPHEVGSLHQVLAVLAKCEANMTKIQSVPMIGSKWQYLFFIDFVLKHASDFEETISELNRVTSGLRILGNYKTGNHYED